MAVMELPCVFLLGCGNFQDNPLQKQCAKQGENYFKKEYGDGVFDNKERSGSVSFDCHYHQTMKACFIVLDENGYERSADQLYEKKTLLNIPDGKQYGQFYNIGASTACAVAGKQCHSEDEWDELVKPYMED